MASARMLPIFGASPEAPGQAQRSAPPDRFGFPSQTNAAKNSPAQSARKKLIYLRHKGLRLCRRPASVTVVAVRKIFLLVSIVVACWFGGQSTVAAMALYSDCCVTGCTDLAACVHAGCTTCLSGPSVVSRPMVVAAFEPAQTPLDTCTPEWVSVSAALWTPPG